MDFLVFLLGTGTRTTVLWYTHSEFYYCCIISERSVENGSGTKCWYRAVVAKRFFLPLVLCLLSSIEEWLFICLPTMDIVNGHPTIEIVEPTYRLEPDEDEKFYPSKAKAIAEKILADELNNQIYEDEDCKHWSLNISDKVREAIKSQLNLPRYKIIVQTTIGQMRNQGIRVASRCLWDLTTDNYASVSYTNVSF